MDENIKKQIKKYKNKSIAIYVMFLIFTVAFIVFGTLGYYYTNDISFLLSMLGLSIIFVLSIIAIYFSTRIFFMLDKELTYHNSVLCIKVFKCEKCKPYLYSESRYRSIVAVIAFRYREHGKIKEFRLIPTEKIRLKQVKEYFNYVGKNVIVEYYSHTSIIKSIKEYSIEDI